MGNKDKWYKGVEHRCHKRFDFDCTGLLAIEKGDKLVARIKFRNISQDGFFI